MQRLGIGAVHGHPGAATRSHGSGRIPPGGPGGRPVHLVFSGATTTTGLSNVYFDILQSSGMMLIDGKLLTMEVIRGRIFVEGYRINPKRLGLSLGHDLSDESSGHKGYSLGVRRRSGP